jgi:nucleotide-binding universal stress UspA family protein
MGHGGDIMAQKILCLVDGSEDAGVGVPKALELAKLYGASVTLCTVHLTVGGGRGAGAGDAGRCRGGDEPVLRPLRAFVDFLGALAQGKADRPESLSHPFARDGNRDAHSDTR